jgi:hypothetical protein
LKSDDTDANQDVWGKHHDSYLKESTTTTTASVTGASSSTASRDDRFFARVDELRAYKAKHGHLNVRCEEDQSLYDLCKNLRESRRAIITGKGKGTYRLDETRIVALDTIDFNWNHGA